MANMAGHEFVDSRPEGAPPGFTVVSYNVHRCIGMDRRHDPERVARVIREADGQVVGMQEVKSTHGALPARAQMDYLSRATGLAPVAGPTILRKNSEYGNVLLTSYPVVYHRGVDLTVNGREPRGALEAVLDIYGREVRIVVTHLGLNPAERRHQVARLLEIATRETQGPLIVMGDINEWFPPSPALRSMNRHLGATRALPTFPSRLPVLALDRIWVRPKRALVALAVHRSALARIASDHLPVRAELVLPDE
jgi:endonuclease/exonuclease/phosphatase family metal-dependent hydrolase